MWCVQRRGEEKGGEGEKKREEGYERKEKTGDDWRNDQDRTVNRRVWIVERDRKKETTEARRRTMKKTK